MMENAGRNLAGLTIKLLGINWAEKQIGILVGKGNNGGGGICSARHLINHCGMVELVFVNKNKLNEVSAYQKLIYENSGGKNCSFEEVEVKLLKPDIIIGAIIGYNLKDEPEKLLLI